MSQHAVLYPHDLSERDGMFIKLCAVFVCSPASMTCTQGFKLGWKLFGMWMGMTIALFIIAIVVFIIFARMDWDEEVRKANDRIGADDAPIAVGH
jgi:MATE family multidrug resistance protein